MYEPPRRLIYKARSAAEVLGYTHGYMHQLVKFHHIEAWPYGRARRFGTYMPSFYGIPHRAIRKNLEMRGATHYLHAEPVWKPLYTVAETLVLLDTSHRLFGPWVKRGDLEVVSRPPRPQMVTRLSIDALLERWEAGELSDLAPRDGELSEKSKAPQFRPPLEGRGKCGWCGLNRTRGQSVVVMGRVPSERMPRHHPRRVCVRCAAKRVETVRGILAGGRPAWLDDGWVPWSEVCDQLGVDYTGIQPNLQAAIRAGVAKRADFRAGGLLFTEREEPGPEVELEPSDDEWEWEPDIAAAVERMETG